MDQATLAPRTYEDIRAAKRSWKDFVVAIVSDDEELGSQFGAYWGGEAVFSVLQIRTDRLARRLDRKMNFQGRLKPGTPEYEVAEVDLLLVGADAQEAIPARILHIFLRHHTAVAYIGSRSDKLKHWRQGLLQDTRGVMTANDLKDAQQLTLEMFNYLNLTVDG